MGEEHYVCMYPYNLPDSGRRPGQWNDVRSVSSDIGFPLHGVVEVEPAPPPAPDGFSVLHHFGGPDAQTGWAPIGNLAEGPDGTVYGAAEDRFGGLIYRVSADGTDFMVLKRFTNTVDGAYPVGGVTLSGGMLYGTTSDGGTNNSGTVFKLRTDGSNFAVLHHFTQTSWEGSTNEDGAFPLATVTLSGNTIYGVASSGGQGSCGTVFRLAADGTGFETLKHFWGNDGCAPWSELLLDQGILYGSTTEGGSEDYGVVFKLQTNGSNYMVLEEFTGANGAEPCSGLVRINDYLYGMTQYGGTNDDGVIYAVSTNGGGFVLRSLSPLEGEFFGGTMAWDGTNLFGVCQHGGTAGLGLLFSIGTNGSNFTVVHEFSSQEGAYPVGALKLSGQNLLGITTGSDWIQVLGTVYRISTTGSNLINLRQFTGGDGEWPVAALALADGILYGTTCEGGSNYLGTFFTIDAGSGRYQLLRSIEANEGDYPQASATVSGENLYVSMQQSGPGGQGTLLAVSRNGSFASVLKAFSSESGGAVSPASSLLQLGDYLYGTTSWGGANDLGAVFTIKSDGSDYKVLKSFAPGETAAPSGDLAFGGGTLFGTTYGWYENGAVFAVNTNGSGFLLLKQFTKVDGASPQGGILLEGATLYGTTRHGGAFGWGTVFSLETNGAGFATLHNFTGLDGHWPSCRLLAVNGTLYGTTQEGGRQGCGTIFKVNTNGTGFVVLHHLTEQEGHFLISGLVHDQGILYGVSQGGGVWGRGAVYSLPIGPWLANCAMEANGLGFSFQSELGKTYTLLYKNDLRLGDWQPHHVINGDGTFMRVVVPITNELHEFFRIREP